jgi:hypothetical protein
MKGRGRRFILGGASSHIDYRAQTFKDYRQAALDRTAAHNKIKKEPLPSQDEESKDDNPEVNQNDGLL